MKALYNEIWKFIFIFQIFALCPFGRNRFQNYILSLCSLLYFVLLAIFSLVAMFNNRIIHDSNAISAMVVGLIFLSNSLTMVIIILQAFVSRYDLKKFLTEISCIDEMFCVKLHRMVDYTGLKRKYSLKVGVELLITKGLFLFIVMFLAFGSRQPFFLFWLPISFSCGVINMRCIQNIFFVDLLRERLEFLNQRLTEISQRRSKDRKLLLYIEAHDHRNRLSRTQSVLDEFGEVLALKRIYSMIWNASILLNNCFGWSVLAIVTRSFIGFICHGYWLFLGFRKLIDFDLIVDTTVNFVFIAMQVSSLCLSCYNCTICVSAHVNNRKFLNFAVMLSLSFRLRTLVTC